MAYVGDFVLHWFNPAAPVFWERMTLEVTQLLKTFGNVAFFFIADVDNDMRKH